MTGPNCTTHTYYGMPCQLLTPHPLSDILVNINRLLIQLKVHKCGWWCYRSHKVFCDRQGTKPRKTVRYCYEINMEKPVSWRRISPHQTTSRDTSGELAKSATWAGGAAAIGGERCPWTPKSGRQVSTQMRVICGEDRWVSPLNCVVKKIFGEIGWLYSCWRWRGDFSAWPCCV